MKKQKSGIHKALVCKKCGHRMGYLRVTPRLKWKMVWYAVGVGLVFELIANTLVFLLFR